MAQSTDKQQRLHSFAEHHGQQELHVHTVHVQSEHVERQGCCEHHDQPECHDQPNQLAQNDRNRPCVQSICTCHYKETERGEKLQSDVRKRLNRAIGQLNGVKGMIDDNRYCGDVLTQLAAAERAVHSAAELILRDHLETCVKDRIRRGDDEVIEEAMRLIKKFARS